MPARIHEKQKHNFHYAAISKTTLQMTSSAFKKKKNSTKFSNQTPDLKNVCCTQKNKTVDKHVSILY